jgi:hypothetical protein
LEIRLAGAHLQIIRKKVMHLVQCIEHDCFNELKLLMLFSPLQMEGSDTLLKPGDPGSVAKTKPWVCDATTCIVRLPGYRGSFTQPEEADGVMTKKFTCKHNYYECGSQ